VGLRGDHFRQRARLLATPIFALISWVICLPSGCLSAFSGPRLGEKFQSQQPKSGGALATCA